jgi:hypothetical protein
MVFNEIRNVGLKRAVSECYRVLCPGGALIGTVTHPDFVDSLTARGMLRRGPGGNVSMPGSDGLRLPVVCRSLREYLSILQDAGFECRTENIFATPEVLNLKPGLREVRHLPVALVIEAAKGHRLVAGPRDTRCEHQGDTRWTKIARESPELADDLQVLGHLAMLDTGSALNKIRFIAEKVLHNLCRGENVAWGQAEPTLERMIGPLVSTGVMPKNVSLHVRTIQVNVSPGSHYQESALSASHVGIAQSALVELLEWFCNSAYRNINRKNG